ncbi:MAG TPA: biopolymer transporter ExbD [Planctomycetaceae bacterium]|nr:biopolymer transporter ExbD [Planctomycetaceae bacterium]
MRVRNVGRHKEELRLMMTPMIDIVFLLLVFFIMTFKIVAPEGDFNIRMPAAAPSQSDMSDLFLPLRVRMDSDDAGRLTGVWLAEARMNDAAPFQELRERIVLIAGDDAGPGSGADDREIELDCDYNLRFEYVIDAITAVSGKVQQGEIIKLIDKIKFAPPRGAPQP